jgi:hypothetical protein
VEVPTIRRVVSRVSRHQPPAATHVPLSTGIVRLGLGRCSQLLASEDNSGPASGLQGESSRHARILPISVRIAFNRALYKTTNKIAKNHRTFIRPDTNLMISSKKTFTFSPYRSEPFLPLRRNVPELCPPRLELSRLWNCESFLPSRVQTACRRQFRGRVPQQS